MNNQQQLPQLDLKALAEMANSIMANMGSEDQLKNMNTDQVIAQATEGVVITRKI